jgi:PAS domain-containing protein
VREELLKAVREKRDYAIQFRIVLPDGTIKYLEATGHHVFSASGDLVEVIGTHVDVTERKRAELALRESQEALRESERSSRSALDGIAGLVSILAPNGEVETVNRQILEYYGRSLEWLKNWGNKRCDTP